MYIYIICLHQCASEIQKICVFMLHHETSCLLKYADIKPRCLIGMMLMVACHYLYEPPQQAVNSVWNPYGMSLVGMGNIVESCIVQDFVCDSLQVAHDLFLLASRTMRFKIVRDTPRY